MKAEKFRSVKQDGHSTGFPGRAFYPASIRPVNREVANATFLNVVLGVDGAETKLQELLSTVANKVLTGDLEPRRKAEQVVRHVMFPSSDGYARNASLVLRVSHPVIAQRYIPKSYGLASWVQSFLHHSGLTAAETEALRALAKRAGERPMHVLEKAIDSALHEVGTAERASEEAEEPTAGQPPFLFVHEQFARLVRGRLPAHLSDVEALTPYDAEETLADIQQLFTVCLWAYWVQLHANAHVAVQNLRIGEDPSPQLLRWYFGYETEAYGSVAGRPFAQTRRELENVLTSGSTAILALSAVHRSVGLQSAHWFSQLNDVPTAPVRQWLVRYVEDAKVEVQIPEPGATATECAVALYDAIRAYYNRFGDQGKFTYTVGFGVARQVGQASRGALLRSIGKGAGRGLTAMIDAGTIMLLARCIGGEKGRARWHQVEEALQSLGILLDNLSVEQALHDLEMQGSIRTLSDSGEAIYIEIQ